MECFDLAKCFFTHSPDESNTSHTPNHWEYCHLIASAVERRVCSFMDLELDQITLLNTAHSLFFLKCLRKKKFKWLLPFYFPLQKEYFHANAIRFSFLFDCWYANCRNARARMLHVTILCHSHSKEKPMNS